jgi:hypothetical protein
MCIKLERYSEMSVQLCTLSEILKFRVSRDTKYYYYSPFGSFCRFVIRSSIVFAILLFAVCNFCRFIVFVIQLFALQFLALQFFALPLVGLWLFAIQIVTVWIFNVWLVNVQYHNHCHLLTIGKISIFIRLTQLVTFNKSSTNFSATFFSATLYKSWNQGILRDYTKKAKMSFLIEWFFFTITLKDKGGSPSCLWQYINQPLPGASYFGNFL